MRLSVSGAISFLLLLFLPLNSEIITIEISRAFRYIYKSPKSKSEAKLGLALSGGGVRGLAHIGVLKAFEENGINVDLIAGTSMGACVGGFYAAGYTPDEIEHIVKSVNWSELLSNKPSRLSLFITQRMGEEGYFLTLPLHGFTPVVPKEISTAQKVFLMLSRYLGKASFLAREDFRNLHVPFIAVATDIEKGKPVLIEKGGLPESILASMAFPFLFPSVAVESLHLVDGGLTLPVPVSAIIEKNCDIVIAVDAASKLYPYDKIDSPIKVIDQTTTIMAEKLREMENSKAHLTIIPSLDNIGTFDFNRIDDAIKAGYKAGLEAVDSVKKLITIINAGKGGKTIDSLFCLAKVDGIPEELKNINPFAVGYKFSLNDVRDFIEYVYRTGNYYEPRAKVSIRGDTMDVSFEIKRLPIITEVHIYGITIFPSDSLERFFDRLVGRRANMEEIEDFLEDVVAYYKRAGYSLADFDTVNIKEDGVLEAKFNERAIEKITFIGNNRTRNWMVRSYLLFKEGDIFNEKNLEESVNRLYSTGLFRIVHYKIREFGSGVEIILIFEESEPGLLRVGVRYDLLSKNELSLSIVDKNIFGLATRFSAKCIYGERRNYFGVELVTDRLWKTHITTSFLASYRNKSLDIFDKSFKILELKEKRRGLTIRFGQHISRLGLFLVELSTEHITLKEFGNIRERYATHTLTFRSIVDSYDRAQFPTSGKYHTSYLKLSQNILGSQTSYWQTFLLFESYYSFFRQYLSFHPRLSFGLSGGFLPLSETFALGDYAPFWGFRGGEIRGYSTLLTGIDIILNLPYNLHLLSGIVVGNAWGKKERVKFDELTWGYGAGVGIRTPAGPIKLLWGKNKLKRERLEFKVGFEF